MPSENIQKIKLLKMIEMLMADSSPEHPLTIEVICHTLASFDISCDRRIVTRDINTLREFGYNMG